MALAILACALLLRVLIPQGWMPVQSGQGWIITICTGNGPMQMAMPMDMANAMSGTHHAPDQHVPAGTDHPCAFAGLAAPLQAPELPTLAFPLAAPSYVMLALATAVTIGHGLAAPPPPSTGPPSLF